MRKYFVTITETLVKRVEVMADNKMDAEEQVKAMYVNQELDMSDPDSISCDTSEAYIAD